MGSYLVKREGWGTYLKKNIKVEVFEPQEKRGAAYLIGGYKKGEFFGKRN